MAQITLTNDGGVVSLTLNRPPANSFDMDLTNEFLEAIETLKTDHSAKVVVIASALPKIWQGGADLKMMSDFASNGDYTNFRLFIKNLSGAFNELTKLPQIVIGAINGHALGGGCELALGCDIRFMAKGGPRIGLTEVNFGIFPGAGGTQRLPRLIGYSRALEMIIQGQSVQADEAERIGLVNKAVEPAELMPKTLELAKKLASGPTQAFSYVKQSVYRSLHSPVEEGVAFEGSLFDKVTRTEDAKEGMAAFNERRPAAFKGR
ncbi:MAG: enoyl-CoA hydratase/isomerase family protein [Chloroflexi bacterium]|nr:enoyl-CoA hydratase/isomerase family protein [Chloroflexota bacterium]